MKEKIAVFAAKASVLEDPLLYKKATERVSPERLERTLKYLRVNDRYLSLGAEILLSHALEKVTGRKHSLSFIYGENGKPELKDKSIFFNLSHSGEYVLCAVSEKEVGCDIEKINTADIGIARKMFAASEYEAIASEKDEAKQNGLFYGFWTAKESFMKQTGLGMKLPLDSFEIVFGKEITVEQSLNEKIYTIVMPEIADGYKAAVCAEDRYDMILYKERIIDILR